MGTTMSMLDMYLPAVLSVIYGNELPKDAIRCVEAKRCNSGEAESGGTGSRRLRQTPEGPEADA